MKHSANPKPIDAGWSVVRYSLAPIGRSVRSHPWRRFFAALLVASFLSTTLIAAVETWHHSLHHDEGASGHLCLVTLMQSGQFLADGSAGISLPLATAPVATLAAQSPSVPMGPTLGLHFGRAPPL